MATLIDTELQYHLQIKKGDVGRYVILAGDPGRIPIIAEHFDNPVKIAQNREYTTYTGFMEGVKVSAVSTGIGGPSAAIAVEELIKCGADTFIRVGTSGGMDLKVLGGDIVIASAAIRSEGTSHEYIPAEYPATADFEVVAALKESAEELCSGTEGDSFHIGVVHSKDSFYGETNPETMAVESELNEKWKQYIRCGALTSEMECAAIFSASIVRGTRAGAVLTVLWNVERAKTGEKHFMTSDSTKAIKCAVNAIRRLINLDGRKGRL